MGDEAAWKACGFHDDLGDAPQAAFAEPVALHWVLDDGEHVDIWVVPPNGLMCALIVPSPAGVTDVLNFKRRSVCRAKRFGLLSLSAQVERGMPSTLCPRYARIKLFESGATVYSRVSRAIRSTS